MPIQLPDLPALAQIKPRLLKWGGALTPTLGGPVQLIGRLGSRYAIDVQMPSLDADCARTWLAARDRADAENDTLLLNFPEADSVSFSPVILIDGNGQAGTNLAVKNLAPGAVVPAHMFFSTDVNSQKFLYKTTSQVAAGSDGKAILTISPMLRRSPVDSLGLYVAPAVMEGFIPGATLDWELQLKRWTSFSFTLQELE